MPKTGQTSPGKTVTVEQDSVLGLISHTPESYIQDTIGAATLTLERDLQVGFPFILRVHVPSGVAVGTIPIFDANAPFKFRIIDAWVQNYAATSGGTVKLNDGTADITTTAMDGATNHLLGRATVVDDERVEIASGGTLSVVTASAGNQGEYDVYIMCMRVP